MKTEWLKVSAGDGIAVIHSAATYLTVLTYQSLLLPHNALQ